MLSELLIRGHMANRKISLVRTASILWVALVDFSPIGGGGEVSLPGGSTATGWTSHALRAYKDMGCTR